jgi:hypothetical protein
MSFATSSSTSPSQRDERVFAAAFGMMDSNQDGESVAAFMRVRDILHRHGGGFRRLLERLREAEQRNEELGRQNAQLLRENAALRARDSRPVSPAPAGCRRLVSMPGMTSFQNWDIGLIVIIAVWAGFGLLGVTTALSLVAAALVFAALTNWFSPVRFFAGLLVALAAYGTLVPQPAIPQPPAYAVAVAKPPPIKPPPIKPPPQIYAGTAAPATLPVPVPADTALQRQPDTPSPFPQISTDPQLRVRAVVNSAHRPPAADPRTRAKADCGPSRLQPGYNCPRSDPWHSSPDSERPPGTRSE